MLIKLLCSLLLILLSMQSLVMSGVYQAVPKAALMQLLREQAGSLGQSGVANQPCTLSSGETGVCKHKLECTAFGGTNDDQFCDFNHVCCLHYLGCNDVSSEAVTHYVNPQWPYFQSNLMECGITINPATDTCAVRIEFEEFLTSLPLNSECGYDKLFIDATSYGVKTRLGCRVCGRLKGVEYNIPVRKFSTSPIKLYHFLSGIIAYRWKIKITQIKCADIQPKLDDDGICGTVSEAFDLASSHHRDQAPLSEAAVVPSNKIRSKIPTENGEETSDTSEYFGLDLPQPNLFSSALEELLSGKGQSDSPRADVQQRITSGQEVPLGRHPWVGSLLHRASVGGRFHPVCGGTVISRSLFLVASHCVIFLNWDYEDRRRHMAVLLGTTTPYPWSGQVMDISAVIPHPKYITWPTVTNDIALVRFKRKITFSPVIRPVCLPLGGASYVGEEVKTMGWDDRSRGGPLRNLQEASLAVMSHEDCSLAYNPQPRFRHHYNHQVVIEEQMMCLRSDQSSACLANCGSPAVLKESDRFRVVGVASFVPIMNGTCSASVLPGVYTRVSEYQHWIYASQ